MGDVIIMPGAEPFYAEGGPIGVLLAHGFTGTPAELRPIAEKLTAAGYTVALPRLQGHGTTPSDLATTTARDWVASIEEAAEWLGARCERLFMAGLSMGGSLTLYQAGQHPERFAGIIPINPAIALNHGPALARLALAPDAPDEIPWGGGADIKDTSITVPSYPVVPVATLMGGFALARIVDELLPAITCPLLVMVSRDDHLVPPANAVYILGRVSSTEKEVLWLEDSYHVATLDYDRELILARMLVFIEQHSNRAQPVAEG